MIHFTPEQEKLGLIRVDSKKGKQLGLTSDRFTEDSYLWLEVKKWGIEQTAEKAAEMGDTETYLEYCKKATIIELQLENARRKLKSDVGDVVGLYGHSVTPNMEL